MSEHLYDLIWLGGGLLLLGAELLIPGGVVAPLGAAAVLVAGLRWIGLLEGHVASLATWMGVSVALVVVARVAIQRWSHPDRTVASTDEDLEIFGATAEVAETITEGGTGRIRFRGTTWPARCLRGSLEPGVPVRIVDRDNLSFLVEPLSPLAEPRRS